ncbi:MAG: hypothetical protein R2748_03220 [Bryobacterales bacterium]
MRRWLAVLLFAPLLHAAEPIEWKQLDDLPEPLGVAGPFVAAGERLLVGGGANFPVSPFTGGQKQWDDRIWAYQPGEGWSQAGTLPRPLGYGVSVQTPDGAVWAGGSNATEHFRDVWHVRFDGEARFDELPPLPSPCANAAGAFLNDVMYVAGCQASPTSTEALHAFWALDLAHVEQGWQVREPWPGPARILPVMAAQDGAVYLFSGAELLADADGKPTRRFLRDGYRYRPEEGWSAVQGPPQATVAAPSVAWGPAHIFVFGGDDGSNFFRNEALGDQHPGFPRATWAYHTITDTWTNLGDAPFGQVTTTAVVFGGDIVVPSGEDRPGHRSPQVWAGRPHDVEPRFAALDYVVLVLYLAGLVGIGFYVSRHESTTDDFFLAGASRGGRQG